VPLIIDSKGKIGNYLVSSVRLCLPDQPGIV